MALFLVAARSIWADPKQKSSNVLCSRHQLDAKELPSRNSVLCKSMDDTVYSVLLQHTFQTLLTGMHCQI